MLKCHPTLGLVFFHQHVIQFMYRSCFSLTRSRRGFLYTYSFLAKKKSKIWKPDWATFEDFCYSCYPSSNDSNTVNCWIIPILEYTVQPLFHPHIEILQKYFFIDQEIRHFKYLTTIQLTVKKNQFQVSL